ncbi:MAG: ABC transporter substrate-binding protein [Methanothrix sp.]|nr:ABC transporter substrate-binding protein [Methanothrix sp.]
MKLRRPGWSICLVLALVLSACNTAATNNKSCPPLAVGVVVAGSDVSGGQEQREGYELALSEINQAGGVLGCPVSLVYQSEGDSANPDDAQVAMLNLSDQGVLAVLGSTSNDATKRVAAISSYFKIPVLVATETGDDILTLGSSWVFRIPPANKTAAGAAFDMVKATLGSQVNLAILYEHTEYGESAATAAGQAALNRGLRLVEYLGYFPAAIDYAAILAEIKSTTPDVIYLINSDPKQALDMITTFQGQYLGVTMMIGNGSGFTSRDFLYDKDGKLTSSLESIFVTSAWSADLPYHGSGKFGYDLTAFRQTKGDSSAIPPVVRNVEAYTALHVAVDAIDGQLKNSSDTWLEKLAKPENLPAFREALAAGLRAFKGSTYQTLFGPLEFDTEGQNKLDSVVLQIQGGKLVTVYPPSLAVQAPAYTKGW